MDWSKYLANGIPVTPDNPAQPRKEIRDLKPEEKWLYLQGLAKFQAQSSEDPLSYYQIAGIHGLPATTWPNLPGNNEIPHDKGSNGGFCTHSSIIFLTWHRPYLALFESALYKHVNDVANGISSTVANRDTYLKAAKSFRMPYWDWARQDRGFPEDALTSDIPSKTPTFTVKNFDGAENNTLLYYKFPPGTPRDITGGYFRTVRRPGETNLAQSLKDEAQNFRDAKRTPGRTFVPDVPPQPRNLTERLSYQLSSYKRYGPMSNNAFLPPGSDPNTANAEIWGSMEDIHNAVHVFCGGQGGHMGDPAVAGFDPLFWLHHTNIDRMLAIWQAMNSTDTSQDGWVTDQRSMGPGWANGDTIIDPKTGRRVWGETAKTKLYPFRQDVRKDAWYDSTMVKRTEAFGYTYPETADVPTPITSSARSTLEAKINALYPPPARAIALSMRKVSTAGEQLLPQATILKQIADEKIPATHAELTTLVQQLPEQEVLLKASLEPEKPRLRKLASDDNKYLEWLFNIKAEKHALGGKYSVSVFLGAVEEEAVALWPFSPHYVGTFYPFGQPTDTQCGKCKEDQAEHLQITGQIPLTVALMERYLAGMVENLDAEPVVKYLKANLHWRLESNGTVLDDRSQLPGLKVFVVSNEVTIPEDENQTPMYAHDVRIHPEITTKEDGSAGRGEGTGLVVGET